MYIKSQNESTRELLDLINEFSNVTGYEVNILATEKLKILFTQVSKISSTWGYM